jgi:ankyrin repeat protein
MEIVRVEWAECVVCQKWRIVPRPYGEEEDFDCSMVGKSCNDPEDKEEEPVQPQESAATEQKVEQEEPDEDGEDRDADEEDGVARDVYYDESDEDDDSREHKGARTGATGRPRQKRPAPTPAEQQDAADSLKKQRALRKQAKKPEEQRRLAALRRAQLIAASHSGDAVEVKALLAGSVEGTLDAEGDNAGPHAGWTPLTAAAANGHHEVVRLLLDAKAAVNQPARGTAAGARTALQLACERGHADVLDALLANSAHAGGSSGSGVGGGGISSLPKKPAIALDQHDDRGVAPLHVVVVTHGHMRLVRHLLEAKATPDTPTANGEEVTPLHLAAQAGNAEAVDALLRAGARASVADCNGATPLWMAALGQHGRVVERLVQARGVDVNTPALDGDAPLWAAVLTAGAGADGLQVSERVDGLDKLTSSARTASPRVRMHWRC